MINFAICEDNPILRKNNVDEITSFMMNYNIEYDTYEFSTYDKDFENFVRKDYGFKVYLLDIVTEGKSGIDAARMIREKYDDWVSVIIMVTSHQEYKYEALASRLYILDFVNKVTKYQRKIREDLIIMLKSYDKKYKMLSYEYAHSFYKIEFRQIIWIEKEPDSKRCIIRTKMGQQFIPGTLSEIEDKVDKRFFRCHKSVLINLNEIKCFEIRKNKVTFKNGDYTYLVSRNKKKELIDRVCNND